ncbi:DUF2683 family protein [Thalassotalea marina]|uniref:DUF2683 family protein n=1 Tax=Thalassotalea marina TaxID=1673741 RepID=UPI001678868D|nr:DUF2683 family protein [Thalassotalea marina]
MYENTIQKLDVVIFCNIKVGQNGIDMAAVDTRNKIKIETDCKRILGVLKRRHNIKTESQAVNMAIRLAGVQIHLADVNETNELLHVLSESMGLLPEQFAELKGLDNKNEKILIRIFAHLRRLALHIEQEKGVKLIERAELDFKQHFLNKSNSENSHG